MKQIRLNKCLLNTYSALGTVLGAGTQQIKADANPSSGTACLVKTAMVKI